MTRERAMVLAGDVYARVWANVVSKRPVFSSERAIADAMLAAWQEGMLDAAKIAEDQGCLDCESDREIRKAAKATKEE